MDRKTDIIADSVGLKIQTQKCIENLTEIEAKELLNEIADVFKICALARKPQVILTNIHNAANDEFCRYRNVVEFLEGTTFRLTRKATGYIFTRPGYKPDASGNTIMEAVERAIRYEEDLEDAYPPGWDEPKIS